MAVYTLTLAEVRDRAEFKLRDDQTTTQIDNWINDVVQSMTAEVFFMELYKEGASVKFTGDGTNQIFDCEEDHAAFAWVYSDVQDRPLIEVSAREMVEDWTPFDTPVQTPQAYAPLGRTGTAGATSNVPVYQVKFDSIVPNGEEVLYAYYALHPELVNDDDVILLPQNLLKTIVDGVLLEADSWNDSDQFAMHRDRFLDMMNQLKRNQNRLPNRRRGMGRSPRGMDTRPGRVTFPSNYPDVWGTGLR